jgi:GxxExxY protein
MNSFAAKDAKDAKENMSEEEIGRFVVDASMKVHTALGAGLLETIYETCLAYELEKQGVVVKKQVALPIVYDDLRLDNAFRIDLLVDDKVVVEIKAIDNLLPVHTAQLLSYLKLGKYKLGFLLNFNVVHMKDGVKRMVNRL